MSVDVQLTLFSTFLLMAAVVWPLLFDFRRRARLPRARTAEADRSAAAHAAAFVGAAVLTAAGVSLLVVAGLL